MLPEKLEDLLKNNDPEDLSISVIKAGIESGELVFRLKALGSDYNDEEQCAYEWTVNTVQHRESRLSFDVASDIVLEEDHPLLWQYSDKQSEIYFRGVCNGDGLLFDLYRTHHFYFRGLRNFEDTLNQSYNFNRLIQSQHGLLAKGPNRLLNEYGSILKKYGLRHSIIGNRTPGYWDGGKYTEDPGNVQVLFIGNSFIIAEQFLFTDQKDYQAT